MDCRRLKIWIDCRKRKSIRLQIGYRKRRHVCILIWMSCGIVSQGYVWNLYLVWSDSLWRWLYIQRSKRQIRNGCFLPVWKYSFQIESYPDQQRWKRKPFVQQSETYRVTIMFWAINDVWSYLLWLYDVWSLLDSKKLLLSKDKRSFLNDVCPSGQMMYPAGMMLPSAMMCPAGHERQTSHHYGTKCRASFRR